MRRGLKYSDQWHIEDHDSGRFGPGLHPSPKLDQSHFPPGKEPDNTSFPPTEEMKHSLCPSETRPETSSLTDLWRRHISRTYQVMLLVQPEKVQALTTVQWHRSQRCTVRPDGYAIMEFRVQCLSAIKSWLNHHAPAIQIIRTVSP